MTPGLSRLEVLTAKLDEKERAVAAFFDLARDCMVIYDARSGMMVRVNRAWEELFGYSDAEMRQMRYDALLHPDDVDATHQRVEGRMSGEVDGTEKFRNRYVAKDGTVHKLEWLGSTPHDGLIYAIARPVD